MMRRILAHVLALALAIAPAASLRAEVSVNQRASTGNNTGAAWLLKAGGTSLSTTGSTSETTLATVTIPAGAMGTSGGLIIYSTWSTTSSANNKTPRIRLGGTSGTIFFAPIITTNSGVSDLRRIRNRGSAASQVSSFSTSSNAVSLLGSSPVTATVDTSASVDLVFSCQLALSSESCALENYEVWVLP